MGFLVQALLIDADHERVERGIPIDHPEVLEDDPESYDPRDLKTFVATMRLMPSPCRRGGDRIANTLLDDPEWLYRHLSPALMDWTNIEAVAYRLLTTGYLDREDIDNLMGTQTL